MDLKHKVVLVTGGAVRVGRAIALAAAERGAWVAITYRSSAGAARQTVDELRARSGRSLAVPCDQADLGQVRSAIDAILAEFGQVDVLVNSAAIFPRTPLDAVTEDDCDNVFDVNLRGPFFFARHLGPRMQAQGAGKILNMADIAAERPWPNYLPYSITKAGIVAMTRGLSRALAPQVQVNAIAPGAVMWPDDYDEVAKERVLSRVPLQRAGSPDDIASTAMFLLEGPDYITGVVLPVDGGRTLA